MKYLFLLSGLLVFLFTPGRNPGKPEEPHPRFIVSFCGYQGDKPKPVKSLDACDPYVYPYNDPEQKLAVHEYAIVVEHEGALAYYSLSPSEKNRNKTIQDIFSRLGPGDKVYIANVSVWENNKLNEVQGPTFLIE